MASQVASADAAEEVYITIKKAMCREGCELDTEKVDELGEGVKVTVVERATTAKGKRRLRLATATNLRDTKATCTRTVCDFALRVDVQAALTAYVASLKARKK